MNSGKKFNRLKQGFTANHKRLSLVFIQILLFSLLFYSLTPNEQTLPIAKSAPFERGYFHSLTPARLYDSRPGSSAPFGREGYFYDGTTRNIPTRGYLGIPTSATAILANVTVITQTYDFAAGQSCVGSCFNGSITIYPNGGVDFNARAVNWWQRGSWNIANFDIIGLDNNGYFTIKGRGTTDVLIDIYGYIDGNPTGGSVYRPSNGRIYDSRGSGALIRGNGDNTNIRTVQVAGVADVPSNAKSVIINLTASNTSYGGYFTAYPYGYSPPNTSSVNWNDRNAGNIPWDVPNLAIVPLNDGKINVTVGGNNYYAGADIIIDVFGYTQEVTNPSDGFYFYLPNPTRHFLTGDNLGNGDFQTIQVTGTHNIPSGTQAAVVHITVKDAPTGGGFLALYPSNISWPSNSNVNTNNNNQSGQAPGNLAIVPLSPDGKLNVRNGGNSKGFILDIIGFLGCCAPPPQPPYDCQPNRCYGINIWRGGTDGGRVEVAVTPIFVNEDDPDSLFINNAIWVADNGDNNPPCYTPPDQPISGCWLEIGYKGIQRRMEYYVGQKFPGLAYRRDPVVLPSSHFDRFVEFKITRSIVSNAWEMRITVSGSSNAHYIYTTAPSPYPLYPNRINIGQEAQVRIVNATALPAFWRRNTWYSGSQPYYQGNDGVTPPRGEAPGFAKYPPPFFYWLESPSQSSTGGYFFAKCCLL
jgi:hypothetical protein